MEQPVVQWTPSIAACAIVFYTGDRFPGWKNDLFVTALGGQELRRLVIEGNHVVHEEVLFQGLGRVRDVLNGPDGALYVVLNEPGRIVRIVPVPSVPVPSAGASIQPPPRHAVAVVEDRGLAGSDRPLRRLEAHLHAARPAAARSEGRRVVVPIADLHACPDLAGRRRDGEPAHLASREPVGEQLLLVSHDHGARGRQRRAST